MSNGRYAPYIKDLQIDVFPPDKLLAMIGNNLRQEMKKRGLWYQSPGVLDYAGKSWEDHETFYPLKIYFYGQSILTRFLSLQQQALAGNNIDRLIVINIGYDLTALHQGNNPVGRAVYENLNEAIKHLVEENIIKIIRHGENWQKKIDQNTLIGFSESPYEEIQHEDEKDEIDKIHSALNKTSAWNENYFFAELGKRNQQIRTRLCDIICQLKHLGIFQFKFQSLIAAAKRDVCVITIFSEKQNNDEQNDDEQNDDSINGITEDILISILESESNKKYIETSTAEIFQKFEDFCDELQKAVKNDNTQKRVQKRRLQLIIELQEETTYEFMNRSKLSSQEELAKRLNASVGTINNDIQMLRELASPIIKDKIKKRSLKLHALELITEMLKDSEIMDNIRQKVEQEMTML